MKTLIAFVETRARILLILLVLVLLNACTSAQVKTSDASLARPQALAQLDLTKLEATSEGFAKARFASLQPLIEKSLAADDCERVQRYAFESLQMARYTLPNDELAATAMYDAHMAMGYCDLRESRVGNAEAHLIAAANIPVTSQMESSGLASRNLSLARELLLLGERKIVEKFVSLAKGGWKSKDSQDLITKWGEEIEKGLIPDFTVSTKKSNANRQAIND